MMRIGIISDLHIYNRTINIKRALTKLNGVDLILLTGDIADQADEKQYEIVAQLFHVFFAETPVYCISGNHDNPLRNDAHYRNFEATINGEYPALIDDCCAFYKKIQENIDLIGLNPLYHQKQFFFSDRGRQLTFLQEQLQMSLCKYHVVMCHPPLIAHNPQRTQDMAPYIVAEQDRRLQQIVDEFQNIIFLSGHTHFAPTVEFDNANNNLYINCGSICPTIRKDCDNTTQQGNIVLLDINEVGIGVIIKGIHTDKVYTEQILPDLTSTFANG